LYIFVLFAVWLEVGRDLGEIEFTHK